MSLAENLLNSLDETAYANTRIAGGGIEEEHIVVDASRNITVPSNLKTIAVKGDKDIETVTFDCVRYWDGHDLSQFAIYLVYVLPNGKNGTYVPNISKVSDEYYSFDWTLGTEITKYNGSLKISIIAKKTDDNGELLYQWGSFVNSELTISDGLDVGEIIVDDSEVDIVSQAVGKVNEVYAKFGDLDAALDAIIALQESLLPKVLTFSLTDPAGTSTYSFEEGMTWEQWVNSEYNTIGAYVNSDSIWVNYNASFYCICDYDTGFIVSAGYDIVPENTYYLQLQ